MRTIDYCTRCVTPNSRPRIEFDKEGVCNACRHAEEYKRIVNWDEKEGELRERVKKNLERAPDREYDCIVGVSGGKDSTYQAWYLKNKLGLNVLGVTFTPLMPTPVGMHNLRNMIEKVGIDHISINANVHVYSKLTKIFTLEHGDPFKPWFYGVWSGIARLAEERKIPMVFYGEDGETEHGGSVNAKKYSDINTSEGINRRIKSANPLFKTPAQWGDYGFTEEQLRPYLEPKNPSKVDRIFMSHYIPWNNNQHVHFALNVLGGFKLSKERSYGAYTHSQGLDDYIDDLYFWLMYPKFGFTRANKYASIDVREGKLTRDRAVELTRLYDGEFPWSSFDMSLKVLDMTEEEFWDAIKGYIADEENLKRERQEAIKAGVPKEDIPDKPVVWEKTGKNRWRMAKTVHGEERILEIPMKRPDDPRAHRVVNTL
ncbi:MAG: N-acetyl sugar amidotransferase [Candidatus Altiarchaeota archaeon]|nr:N-acetyl sugar amidotransferase [Candidatus Altiarchaeota archaeon]